MMLEIIDYTDEHQSSFEALNREWIERSFWMEPHDIEVLRDPAKNILADGGAIFMATLNGKIAGTVALKFVSDGVYEFTKMAVEEKHRGKKIGHSLALAALDRAKNLEAKKVVLYSSTKLKPALALYRKLGFLEVPVDGPYVRSDIKMELNLSGVESTIRIRQANLSDTLLLASLGAQTFHEAFAPFNSAKDMKAYEDQNFNVARIEEELADPATKFLLAYHKKESVGYAKVRTREIPEGLDEERAVEIERIYVVGAFHGKRVGHTLMDACIAFAKKNKHAIIWLGVWEHNPKAIAFYRRWGFTEFGAHPFWLGDDMQRDILMKKQIL